MQVDINDAIDEATGKNKSYFLKADFLIKKTEGLDDYKRRYSYEQVYLIPEKNTEFTKFINCYNPFGDALANYIELIAILPYPIDAPARLEFSTPNEFHNDFHFRLMTAYLNQLVLENRSAFTNINFEIIPQKDEKLYSV